VRLVLSACLLAVAVAFAFVPGLRAGFVSDAFDFLEEGRRSSFAQTLAHFVPPPVGHWSYRPVTRTVFWLEYHLFGLDPLGYHTVALLCHLMTVALVFALGLEVTRSRIASIVAAATFALSIHAHEVVFDVGDLHNALSGVTLTACVLAYRRGARALSLLLGGLTMGIDEYGMLALPLTALCEGVFDLRQVNAPCLLAALRRLIPLAALTIAYVVLRLAGGGLTYEVEPCRSARCLAVAALEYLNRLFVRPDALLALAWSHRIIMALITLLTLAALLCLLRAWAWREWSGIVFGGGWLAVTTAFSILALFPYVADRFLYLPDIGLSLLLGAGAAQTFRAWHTAPAGTRVGFAAAALTLGVWVASGAFMLALRGGLWSAAGEEARAIVAATIAAVPSPPPGATLAFSYIPDSYFRAIPPGNTGPYLFRNGLGSAVRFGYGRSDLVVTTEAGAPREAITLAIGRSAVRRTGGWTDAARPATRPRVPRREGQIGKHLQRPRRRCRRSQPAWPPLWPGTANAWLDR
jgi:hypothetical protein